MKHASADTRSGLRRELGLAAVIAIVIGDILGSGIFYTPGGLATIADSPWQVYFIWTLCGLIVLCGALTVAELSVILPRAGATYHMIREGWGPFLGFLKIWIEMWVSGPGSVAGGAILFGAFVTQFLGSSSMLSPAMWGVVAICGIAAINLLGVQWGGRTQIALTSIKVLALLLLIGGCIFATPAPAARVVSEVGHEFNLPGLVRFIGMGVAAVLFTYDGWIDVTHVAGEVRNPARNMTRGLIFGVLAILGIYILANYSFLHLLSLEQMREDPDHVASRAAVLILGPRGSRILTGLMMISVFGSLGGLIMTLPRLFYAGAVDFHAETDARHPLRPFFGALSHLTSRTAVPAGSIIFCVIISVTALLFFQTFNRIVNFFVVSAQTVNILAVASIFRMQRSSSYRMPGYPVVPSIFVGTMILLLASVVVFQPKDSLIGIALTCTGVPVYFWLYRKRRS